jgi:hypothetical protein
MAKRRMQEYRRFGMRAIICGGSSVFIKRLFLNVHGPQCPSGRLTDHGFGPNRLEMLWTEGDAVARLNGKSLAGAGHSQRAVGGRRDGDREPVGIFRGNTAWKVAKDWEVEELTIPIDSAKGLAVGNGHRGMLAHNLVKLGNFK